MLFQPSFSDKVLTERAAQTDDTLPYPTDHTSRNEDVLGHIDRRIRGWQERRGGHTLKSQEKANFKWALKGEVDENHAFETRLIV
jgi:hypothetical protein